jgi:hypothetical protein
VTESENPRKTPIRTERTDTREVNEGSTESRGGRKDMTSEVDDTIFIYNVTINHFSKATSMLSALFSCFELR